MHNIQLLDKYQPTFKAYYQSYFESQVPSQWIHIQACSGIKLHIHFLGLPQKFSYSFILTFVVLIQGCNDISKF